MPQYYSIVDGSMIVIPPWIWQQSIQTALAVHNHCPLASIHALQMFGDVHYQMLMGDGATNAAQQVVVALVYTGGMFLVAQVLLGYLMAILFDPYARLRWVSFSCLLFQHLMS
jgi:hypothetical protein